MSKEKTTPEHEAAMEKFREIIRARTGITVTKPTDEELEEVGRKLVMAYGTEQEKKDLLSGK